MAVNNNCLFNLFNNKHNQDIMKEIIEQLSEARKEQGMTYDVLSEKSHCTRANLCKILNHKAIPEGNTLMRIVDALGYDLLLTPKKKLVKQKP